MKINNKVKDLIHLKLKGLYPEKVINEVMDEFFYMTAAEFKVATKDYGIKALFLINIQCDYIYPQTSTWTGGFGEVFTLNIICAAMHVGAYITTECKDKELLSMMNASSEKIIPNKVLFIDSLDESEAIKLFNKVVIDYKKSIAPIIIIVRERYFLSSTMHTNVFLKKEFDFVMSYAPEYVEPDDFLITNVSADDYANGALELENPTTSPF